MTRPRVLVLLFIVYLVAIRFQSGASSQAPPPKRPPAELLRLSLAAEKPGLAEPFKGITANGQIEPGLFAIRSTGVSTEPVRKAAETFLAGLTQEQRARTRSPWTIRVAQVDEPELLRAPGRELPRDDPGAAGDGVRAAARLAERAGAEADARHHAPQRDARRADRQQLRRVRRVAVSHHGDGHAVGHRAVGLAVRRPPRRSSTTSCSAIRW